MAQCSPTRKPLPASLFPPILAVLCTVPAVAQTPYRTTRNEPFRQEAGPQGKELATIPGGVVLQGGAARDGWVEVVLDGWVWGASVGRTTRDGHNLAIMPSRGENLRVAPNGGLVARLLPGFLLDEVTRDGAWVRAKRSGWMSAEALERVADGDPGSTAAVALPDSAPPPVVRSSLDRAVTLRATPFARTPGDTAGWLPAETPVRLLARNGEWVRVQTEGWVKEADLRSGTQGVLVGVTGAELRARPQDFENKTVQWNVQYLSLRTADELRPEIPAGQRYMLARGPLPEANFLYVSVDAQQLRAVEQLAPLAQLVVVVRIKVPKTRHLGNPVVELVDMQVKAP